MAYGKYRHAEISGQAGTTWYVEIWRKDWAGSSSEIDLHGEGFEVKWTGEGGTRDRQYITSECIVRCNIQNSTDEDFMYDIFSKGDRRYFVRIYKNAISDAGIWWFGWVQPSFSQFENFPFPYQSYITATDSIGTYQKQPEASLTIAETATANAIIEHIKDFGDDSGIYNVTADSGVNNNAPARDNQNWIYTSVDWWRDGDTYQSDDPFSLYRISKVPFRTDPEKWPNRYYKYKVLQESLKTFNTVGVLSDGRYNYIQPNNYKGNTSGNLTFYKYDKGDEADTPSLEVENNLLTIDGTTDANKGVVMGGGSSTYEPPYNSVTANYSFGSAQILILPGDYSSYTFVGDMQNDPSAPDSAHLNVNLNLYNYETLAESFVVNNLNTLSETDPSLQAMFFYSTFYWQVRITDGTSTYYLTHSTTSNRYTWVTTEPLNRYIIGYPQGVQQAIGSDSNYPQQINSSNSNGPCDMWVEWPYINLSSRKRRVETWGSINVEADLPPITGQVHIKLTGDRNVYYYNYDNGTYAGGVGGPINPGGTSWPSTSPFVSSESYRYIREDKYYPTILSNINDSEGSLALTDEGEGLKFVANQTTITAEEDYQLGDMLIGQSGSESVNVNCIQYLNGTTPESVTSGFRRGNSGGFLNPTQLLCNEFLQLQVEPLEILQADIFSPDVSPIKLIKYSINNDSNYNYYSFLGGTFKAQSETMSGEWFKVDNVDYTIIVDTPNETATDLRPATESNENKINNVEESIRYFDSINSIGSTNADIVSGSSINKINFNGTSSAKVYNDQKLYLKHSLAPNGLVVTVDGDSASGVTSIDIDSITPDFPIFKGAKLFVIPSDLTNVITGGSGSSTPNLFRGINTSFIYIRANEFNVTSHTTFSVYTRDNVGSVQPTAAQSRGKIYATTFVPPTYEVTSVNIYANVNNNIRVLEGQTNNDTTTLIDSGTSNTTITLSTAHQGVDGRYLILEFEQGASTDEIYGGKIGIQAV